MWEPKYATARTKISKVILNNLDGIFAGIINKSIVNCKNHTSADIENSVFRISVLEHILPECYAEQPKIIYDARQSPSKTRLFNEKMKKLVQTKFSVSSGDPSMVTNFESVDSIKTPGIWASDFIAGAFYHKLEHNDSTYVDALASKFIGKGFTNINKIR